MESVEEKRGEQKGRENFWKNEVEWEKTRVIKEGKSCTWNTTFALDDKIGNQRYY